MDQESEKVTSDLVLASANAGKIKELQQMLGGLGL
jgi:inosine/xanthosine triphosphate pyrophosphatase family protein